MLNLFTCKCKACFTIDSRVCQEMWGGGRGESDDIMRSKQ